MTRVKMRRVRVAGKPVRVRAAGELERYLLRLNKRVGAFSFQALVRRRKVWLLRVGSPYDIEPDDDDGGDDGGADIYDGSEDFWKCRT